MSEKNSDFKLNINANAYMPMNEKLRQKEKELIEYKQKYFNPMQEHMLDDKQLKVGQVYFIENALEYLNIPNANHTGNKQCVIGNIDNKNVYLYLLNSKMSRAAQNNTEYQKNYIPVYKNSLMGTNENFKIKKKDFLNMINSGQITCIGVCNESDSKEVQKVGNTDMLKRAIENYESKEKIKKSIKKMKDGEIRPYQPQQYNQQYDYHYGYDQMYNTNNIYGNNQDDGYYYGY